MLGAWWRERRCGRATSDVVTRLGDRRSVDWVRLEGREGAPPRARGELRLGFARRGARTRMVEAFQSGCLRARAPNVAPGERPSVVLINTSGGLTGGDRLDLAISWGEGASAEVATQAAEKIYRSTGDDACVEANLHVASGASAEWLPQETILFDRARLARRMKVTMSADASFLGVEMMVFGRAAMGETVRAASLRDTWTIVRDGRLVYADAQRLDGPVDRLMDRVAVGGGARAMAVMIHASPEAAGLLPRVREALAGARVRAAASAWNDLLVTRLLAPDGQALRLALLPALAALRGGRPLPRVWAC